LIAYRWYELRHPNEPWIAQGAIRFLERALDVNGEGLEWGSGRSTLWFARRLKRLTSVEHNERWYHEVARRLASAGVTNTRLLHVPLDHPERSPTVATYDPVPRYVAVADEFADESLDFVLVDGHYRQACVRAALPKVRRGGLVVIDNSNWLPKAEWGIPPQWPLVHESENVRSQTTIWQRAPS
jgi:predicted O-methyltransferase YrrM